MLFYESVHVSHDPVTENLLTRLSERAHVIQIARNITGRYLKHVEPFSFFSASLKISYNVIGINECVTVKMSQ